MSGLVLASSSPRRRDFFDQLGLTYEIRVPDVDETPIEGEDALPYVERIAGAKAAAVPAEPHEVVVAADTTVAVDGAILGKPVDDDDARSMLASLSGRTHQVHTAVAVGVGGSVTVEATTTDVSFVTLSDADIDWYLSTGEHADKAGAYGIQGAGGVFIDHIQGSYSNVAGLPMAQTVDLMRRRGVDVLATAGTPT